MDVIKTFLSRLNSDQHGLMISMKTPHAIQAYLDSITYSAEDTNRSPLTVPNGLRSRWRSTACIAALAEG